MKKIFVASALAVALAIFGTMAAAQQEPSATPAAKTPTKSAM